MRTEAVFLGGEEGLYETVMNTEAVFGLLLRSPPVGGRGLK